MTRLLLFIALAFALTGCAPRFGVPEQGGSRLPVSTAVVPGQSLTLRLESGDTASVTAGQTYVSALGEECVQINEYPSIGAACLRGGEWMGLPDIFVPRPDAKPDAWPGKGAMP